MQTAVSHEKLHPDFHSGTAAGSCSLRQPSQVQGERHSAKSGTSPTRPRLVAGVILAVLMVAIISLSASQQALYVCPLWLDHSIASCSASLKVLWNECRAGSTWSRRLRRIPPILSYVDSSRSAQSCQFISMAGASASGTASGFARRMRNMAPSLAMPLAKTWISLWILNARASSVSKLEASTVCNLVN